MAADRDAMQSFHESKHLSAAAVDLFHAAQRIVESIPDPSPGEEPWRCHEVARVVGSELGLEVIDGVYGIVDHSWLVIPMGTDDKRDAILDVYAVGALPQVVLVDTYYALPTTKNYRQRETRTDIRIEAIRRMKEGLVKVTCG